MRSRLLMGAVVAGLMVLTTPAAAHAESVSASCSDSSIFGTHVLRADAYYVTSGANHIWTDIGFSIVGDHTGGKSNVNAWLFVNGSNVWSYFSPDNLQHDTPYGAGVGVTVNAAANEYMAFQAIFDVAGPDPKCPARTPSV